MGCYIALASPPLLLSARPASWPLLALLHLAIILLAWPPPPVRRALDRLSLSRPRAARLLLDWYPLLLVPVLYTELSQLIPAVHHGRFFDPIIQRWEQAVFGGQPSRDLAAAFPHRWLSELLHAGYLSYYFLIYVPAILLYAAGRREAARLTIFAVMLTFVVHCLFFIYFPVQGPYYLFRSPLSDAEPGLLRRLTHFVLDAGASRGAAFPSSHVGVAFAQVWLAIIFQRRVAPWLGIVALTLALGAVYGGFHYASDAVCGFALSALAVWLAPAAYRAFGGTWSEARHDP